MSAIKEIERAMLALPVNERVRLAESLLESLPPVGAAWSDEEELAEVERRERQIENDQVQPIPEDEFWKQVEARRKR